MADTVNGMSDIGTNTRLLNFDGSRVSNVEGESFYAEDLATMDLRYGGQWGALPRIGGVDSDKPIHEWMHEQSYLRRDVVPVLLQAPKGFSLLPNGDEWQEAIKALFEVHAKTIEGLNSSLTVEHAEHAMGISGANMREVANVNREASSVTLGGIVEKYGNPFEILLDVWIRYMLMDPDSKAPLITRVASADTLPKAWTAEWYSATVIFIEPDPLYRMPVRAWLVSNLYPSANPDIIGGKDKSAGRAIKEISIDMGGFALPHTNKRVKALASKIITNLKLWEKDPEDILLPADSVDTNLENVQDMDIYYDGVKGGSSKADGSDGSATA